MTHYKVLCKKTMNRRHLVGCIPVKKVRLRKPRWLFLGDLKVSLKLELLFNMSDFSFL